ncbi:UNVERIFIED_CONTAM: hypothetical protein PYX00_009319 [Menopon gallinae]|uniref:Suppressor of white apricot N-terminal domain-containing protein n=1 Tax=Menopon gallinae TaxID=328185 RepID=A0AAW2HAL0_9NEOP
MWHEARKQEKKIRGMMVDYRKRAERRRDFYEKFKADPTQFLQLHGRPCKIHLDPAVAMAGDSASVMMPWQGHPDILIDRFDVRAHLDSVVEIPLARKEEEELNYEERTMNYERYRILVQNEFLGVNEEKFLHQIYLEEQFGPIALKQSTEMMEKEKRKKGAAIGFIYEDSTIEPSFNPVPDKKMKDDMAEKNDSDSDDSDLDFDLCLDLSQIDTPSAHEMNAVGQRFGLTGNDFFSFLTNDVEEQEAMKLARQQEEEKAMFSGRKARRERQAFREKKLMGRVMSPPSYAARKSPTYDKYSRSNKSQSRSTSPENTGQITYITSFGGDDSNDENEQEDKGKFNKTNKKVRRKRSREKDVRSTSTYRSRRSKSKGSRSRSKSPRRRRRHTRSRSMENRSLASNLKKLISKKNERRKSRSFSNDRFRNYSSRSRSRSRSRRKSWSSRSRSRSSSSRSRSRRDRSKSSRSVSKKRSRSRSNSSKSHSRSRSTSKDKTKTHDKSPTSKSSSSSRSPSPKREETPKPVVPRYYGRNRKDSSSSLNLDSSDSDSKTNSEQPSSSNSNRPGYRRVGLDVSNSSIRSAGNARTTSKVSKNQFLIFHYLIHLFLFTRNISRSKADIDILHSTKIKPNIIKHGILSLTGVSNGSI